MKCFEPTSNFQCAISLIRTVQKHLSFFCFKFTWWLAKYSFASNQDLEKLGIRLILQLLSGVIRNMLWGHASSWLQVALFWCRHRNICIATKSLSWLITGVKKILWLQIMEYLFLAMVHTKSLVHAKKFFELKRLAFYQETIIYITS